MALSVLDCIYSPFHSLFCSSGCIFVCFKPTQVAPNTEKQGRVWEARSENLIQVRINAGGKVGSSQGW